MDERLAKLLQVAFDMRCSDGERIAALNAVARTFDAGVVADMLASFMRRADAQEHYTFGLGQQLELLQADILEKDKNLVAANAELARLKKLRSAPVEDGIDIKTVIQITGLSRATLYRRMATAEFPVPSGSAGKTKLWNRSEVSSWSHDRGNSVRH